MSEKSTEQKKCLVTDEDISSLFQRYTITTVLALLQEVEQAKEVNFDWNAMVKKTKTGITNAREYQMLWRHLAYRHAFVDGLVDGAQPLDDDSDLECELEPYPAVSSDSSDALAEATAVVKVLIASGTTNDSDLSNGVTVEAPLTISIPNDQRSRNSPDTSHQSISAQGSNIIVPISVPKKPLPNVISTKGLDTNGPSDSNLPPKRKRKLWSETEDMELIAAVRKRGEGNWASISRGSFKGERTASQLSKRWAVLRKQQGALVGNKSELSEIHLAHRAMSLPLDVPKGDISKAACSIRSDGTNANAASSNPANPLAYDTSSVNTKSQHQGQQDIASNAALKLGALGPSKSLGSEKPSTKPNISTNLMVKAAAVAAGARIGSPKDAASLLMAAQSKNAVHISSGGGGPSIKSSLSGNTNALPSNVHFLRPSLPSNSTPLLSASLTEPKRVQCESVNPASPVVQSNVVAVASGIKASTKVVSNDTHSNPVAELGVKTAKDASVSSLEIVSEKVVPQENQATCLRIAFEGDHITASTRNALLENAQGDQIAIPGNPVREKIGMTQ